jgi:hypothetical protein
MALTGVWIGAREVGRGGLRAEYYYCYPGQMAVLYSLLWKVAEFSVPDR